MSVEKINISEITAENCVFGQGRFHTHRRLLSQALGASEEDSWPFDIEHVGVPPGRYNWYQHTHTHWTEFYIIISGQGVVYRDEQSFEVGPGDCFVQPPGVSHRMRNPSDSEDLVYYIITNEDKRDSVTRQKM